VAAQAWQQDCHRHRQPDPYGHVFSVVSISSVLSH
jgi:hypothetical protein